MTPAKEKNPMSRKIWTLVFIEILLLAGLGVFFYNRYRIQPQPILPIVPARPVVFVHARDLGKNIALIESSQLWQKLSAIPYLEAMRHLKVDEWQIREIAAIRDQLSIPAVRLLLEKFFGQEVVIAAYPPDFEKIDLKNIDGLFSQIVFMTRLEPEAQFAELVSGLAGQGGKQVKVRTITYNEHEIQMIAPAEGTWEIGYARIKNVLVFGYTDAPVRRVLDVLDGRAPAIEQDPFYPLTKDKALADPSFFGFFNVDYFITFMTGKVVGVLDEDKDKAADMAGQFHEYFRQMYGFKMLSVSADMQAGEARTRLNVHIDPSSMDKEFRPFYQCPQKPHVVPEYVPGQVLAYQWSNCYHFDHMWKQLVTEFKKQTMGTSESAEDVIAGLERNMGLSISKDLLPAFGHEIGGYVKDINDRGLFPVPETVIFIRVEDEIKARKVIHTLVELQPFFRLEKEQVGDAEFEFVRIPMLLSLQPGFTFKDDFFILGTHTDLVKEALAPKGVETPSLAGRHLWKKNGDLTENTVWYVQIDELLERIAGLTEWGNQWVTALSARQQAFLAGSQKRLSDIQASIEEKEKQLAKLKEELQDAEQIPVTPSPETVSPDEENTAVPAVAAAGTPEELKERIRTSEDELTAARGAREELMAMIETYENQMQDDPRLRRALLDEVIKPLIGALQSFKSMVSTTCVLPNLIESNTKLTWE